MQNTKIISITIEENGGVKTIKLDLDILTLEKLLELRRSLVGGIDNGAVQQIDSYLSANYLDYSNMGYDNSRGARYRKYKEEQKKARKRLRSCKEHKGDKW